MKFCAKVVVFRGIAYEEGAEAIWCICWWGASPQIAGKGELAVEQSNKHGKVIWGRFGGCRGLQLRA